MVDRTCWALKLFLQEADDPGERSMWIVGDGRFHIFLWYRF
jgi:hypothetical protein